MDTFVNFLSLVVPKRYFLGVFRLWDSGLSPVMDEGDFLSGWLVLKSTFDNVPWSGLVAISSPRSNRTLLDGFARWETVQLLACCALQALVLRCGGLSYSLGLINRYWRKHLKLCSQRNCIVQYTIRALSALAHPSGEKSGCYSFFYMGTQYDFV